jgi:trk system potassium uptake protein
VTQPDTSERARDRHAVVVGCGRVGAGVTRRLLSDGYSVAVIDRRPSSLRRIADTAATTHVGVGFDRQLLEEAGARRACALAAVTNGDNSNIVVARVGREVFGVPSVLARIYDPRRAAIYERLGIPTVASVQWTIEMAMRRLVPGDDGVQWVDPSARVVVVERDVPAAFVGRPISDLERSGELRLVAVRRLGVAALASADLVAQDGDVVYVAVAHDRVAALDADLRAGLDAGADAGLAPQRRHP